jgi:hypothetical protein
VEDSREYDSEPSGSISSCAAERLPTSQKVLSCMQLISKVKDKVVSMLN